MTRRWLYLVGSVLGSRRWPYAWSCEDEVTEIDRMAKALDKLLAH